MSNPQNPSLPFLSSTISPLNLPSAEYVKASYDDDARGHTDHAILDMLRALYQQNEEHTHRGRFRPTGPVAPVPEEVPDNLFHLSPSEPSVIHHPAFGAYDPDNGRYKEGPHSRACGISNHPHGNACHKNCPTCGGTE